MPLDLSPSLAPGYYLRYTGSAPVGLVESEALQVTIYPLFYEQTIIEWSVPASFGECLFDVYESDTEYSGWRKLNLTPIDGNFYKDLKTLDVRKFNQSFYMVECRVADGRRVRSKPTSWENKRNSWVNLRANEIVRREKLLLERFTGVKSVVFKRRFFGKRCPKCWDPRNEKVTQDHCETCFGTSFDGGYYRGLETLFQFDPTPNNVQVSYQGMLEENEITAWTTSKPYLAVRDLVIRLSDNRVYRIDRTQNTELQATTIRQIVSLVELSKNCVEYDLVNTLLAEAYIKW